ncbi:hypothetical protein [Devosia sp.]|uniref:hypothetical protein n=1 Tax=Devosia sp. TaxID=1871048 RepID=UPI001AD135BF|nr:hypothetical protein [Devosia sp.]MBN9332865.1 hypothetical protein [Devosia sp.]
MIDENDPDGFGERPLAGFAHSIDNHVAFYRFALKIYNYRCAISGLRFPSDAQILHQQLEVVPIHPREFGGPLEIGNVLVLETGMADAFARGLVTASDDWQLIVPQPQALNEAQRQHAVAGRVLFVPSEPMFRPEARNLQFHRLTIARFHH